MALGKLDTLHAAGIDIGRWIGGAVQFDERLERLNRFFRRPARRVHRLEIEDLDGQQRWVGQAAAMTLKLTVHLVELEAPLKPAQLRSARIFWEACDEVGDLPLDHTHRFDVVVGSMFEIVA